MGKSFQELDLNNAFLFAAALEDEKTCRIVLEIILGHPVTNVKVHAEHSILYSADFRSIRLDIYASDEMQMVYNIEAQNQDMKNIAKRSRYHQAELDVASLKPGEDFSLLKPSYVIFICTFDPFGENLYRYTFENRCLERDMALKDGTRKLFLNTKGTNDQEVPKALIHFLKYMEESTEEYVTEIKDDNIRQIHNRVCQLKQRRELEASYMTGEELLREKRLEGIAEGKAVGIAEGKAVGIATGKVEDVLELLEEYAIVPEPIKEQILSQQNLVTLKHWLKLAAKCTSLEEFIEKM